MLRRSLKKVAAFLPDSLQSELRRIKTLIDVASGRHVTPEPEFARLAEWLRPGDWCLDVGANIGYYTCRMASLVGPAGRVIALEPVPSTAAVLSAVSAPFENVTILQFAASETAGEISFSIPSADTGLNDYFMARADPAGNKTMLSIPVDCLRIRKLALVKIDVEGHEFEALCGMAGTIARCRPVIIVETEQTEKVSQLLNEFGYRPKSRAAGSANIVFLPLGDY